MTTSLIAQAAALDKKINDVSSTLNSFKKPLFKDVPAEEILRLQLELEQLKAERTLREQKWGAKCG